MRRDWSSMCNLSSLQPFNGYSTARAKNCIVVYFDPLYSIFAIRSLRFVMRLLHNMVQIRHMSCNSTVCHAGYNFTKKATSHRSFEDGEYYHSIIKGLIANNNRRCRHCILNIYNTGRSVQENSKYCLVFIPNTRLLKFLQIISKLRNSS